MCLAQVLQLVHMVPGVLQCPVDRHMEAQAVEVKWEEKSSFLRRILCP